VAQAEDFDEGGKVPLAAGRQVMRVVFDAPAGEDVWVCNLNWIEARQSP
jgi:hypothetical protein